VKRFPSILIILLAVCASAALAHGPVRKKVTVTRQIAASPEEVWALVGNFQDMSWLPIMAKTEGEGGNAPGATHTLTLANGGQVQGKLEKYVTEKHTLFYRIESVDVKILPMTNYSAWVTGAPADGGSLVTWKGAFYHGYPNNEPPPELNDEAAIEAVTGLYNLGLDNLKKIAEEGK
jgi:hypothetical protein